MTNADILAALVAIQSQIADLIAALTVEPPPPDEAEVLMLNGEELTLNEEPLTL